MSAIVAARPRSARELLSLRVTPRSALIAGQVVVGAQLGVVFVQTDLRPIGLAVGLGLTALLVLAAVLMANRHSRASNGGGALVAGVPGTAAGVALTAQVALTDLTWTVLFGALTTLVALGLLIAGSVQLVLAVRGWWRLLALAAGSSSSSSL